MPFPQNTRIKNPVLKILIAKKINFDDYQKDGILIKLVIPCVVAVIIIFVWWFMKKRNEKDD